MKYLVMFFAAVAGIFAALFSREHTQVENEKAKTLDLKEAEDAKTLADAQIATASAKETYDKAMADLPSDKPKPSGS